MNQSVDSDLDLTISRIIRAPRQLVWEAWADRSNFEQWWVPAPARCSVVDLDLRPGGSFVTRISEDGGDFVPHMSACFLDVEQGKRIVFSDALVAGWRPSASAFITAVITMEDHPAGTEYTSYVMHKDQADRKMHEEAGFYDGWGTVADQLTELVENRTRQAR